MEVVASCMFIISHMAYQHGCWSKHKSSCVKHGSHKEWNGCCSCSSCGIGVLYCQIGISKRGSLLRYNHQVGGISHSQSHSNTSRDVQSS